MSDLNFKNKPQNQPTVIFTHIPKTAGTTLKHIMLSQYKPQNVFEFYSLIRTDKRGIDKFETLSESRKNSIKLVIGHIGFGLHKFLARPPMYITMLRDPIKRVISYYHFQCRANHGVVQGKTLEEFVRTSDHTHNDMTQYLSGAKLETQLAYLKNQKEPECECNSNTLDLAKKNLEKEFIFFGVSERFDESLILLKKSLGWKIEGYLTRNVSKKSAQNNSLSKETIRLIEKVNEYDLELYEFAQKLFQQRVEQYQDSINREAKALKEANCSTLAKLYFTITASYTQVTHKTYQTINNILR